MADFERIILDKINNAQRVQKSTPLVLGGSSGSNGGLGGPPGGFVGHLPQKRVAYDTSESETLVVPSGASLLDNLNHIRYRLHSLELGVIFSGSAVTFLDLLDTPDSYVGYAGMVPTVNGTEDGLEFVPFTPAGSTALNIWEPDAIPNSTHLLSDEFDDNSVAVAWTSIIPDATHISFSEGELGFVIAEESLDFDSHKIQGLLWKEAPIGDFSITIKLNSFALGTNTQPGIIIANGLEDDYTSASIYLLGWNYGDDGTGTEVLLMSGFNDVIDYPVDFTSALSFPIGVYIRARYNATTSGLFLDISDNGISWTQRYSTISPFQPTEVGMGMRSQLQGDPGAELRKAYFQYFRVTDDKSFVQIHRGKRV